MQFRQRTRDPCPDLSTRRHAQNHSRTDRFPNLGRRLLGRTYRIGLSTMSESMIKIFAWAICGLAAFTLLWDASKPSQGMLEASAQTSYVTIPLAALPTTTLSTTFSTTPVTACAGALNLALSVGWPASETPTLMRVLKRESRCIAKAHNKKDTVGQSYGLMQINSFWCTPSAYWPKGWLQTQGILTTCDQLLDPKVNLIAGLAVWHNSNWSPWNLPK